MTLIRTSKAGKDVYAVLRDAVASTGKMALARVVIARRERLPWAGRPIRAKTYVKGRPLRVRPERNRAISRSCARRPIEIPVILGRSRATFAG